MSFSVLMSVYMKEKPEYLQACLDSVLSQTVLPNEIVIMEDGKLTDSLYEVLNRYKEANPSIIKCVKLERNMGLGKALEIGVTECKFDLIARMDSDDICHPERFEKQVSYMKEHPKVDVVGTWIGEFSENAEEIDTIRKVPITSNEVVAYAKKRNPLNHMTVMYRKEAVLSAGNYKPMLWNEDYYLWVRMLVKGMEIVNIPEVLVYARTGSEMFKRRGGIKYVQRDVILQIEFLKLGFINISTFLSNIVIRSVVRLLPNSIRGLFYKSVLRK
ncbi:glycosyltransferase [Robertmurraya korlensis]|uniref:glycosyltransferase n=1 Tax=Robertmurraya korlensis TaxID=519977 RepID=UPI000826D5B5|nr:glycosyltransferase [Robertmurraya korlensis]